jgi:hypothetical protein
MRAMKPFVVALCTFGLTFAPALAADEADAVKVPAFSTAPEMSGSLDPAWTKAARIPLVTDFTYRRPAEEATDVYIGQEKGALDIAFVVTQKESVLAAQVTNGSSVTSDDYVTAYLWPQGTRGFAYSFTANPRGTRYQTSSENSAYTPQWEAVGHVTPTGYIITMRIPLAAIRNGGSTSWRAQFARATVATNGLAVWTFSPRQQNVNDPAFAGILNDVGGAAGAARPKPRAQVYGLGELTTPAYGGSTSRMGADLSLPLTRTASFVAAIHPDFSNVEIDQQTIAPNPFAYQYQEVRPFFTQVGQGFNYNFSCSNCPQFLYTPSIPTFRDAYAVEGTQGYTTFSAFDTVGFGRTDAAQALDYDIETKDNFYAANVQRVAVDTASRLHDDLTSITTGISNQKTHFFIYANGAMERGTLVTDSCLGNYLEAGGGYASATTVAVANYQEIGAQFSPVDSFVSQTDLNGYEFFAKRIINFSPGSLLHDISGQTFYAHYTNRFKQRDQDQAGEQIFFDFRNLMTLRLYAQYAAVQTADGEFLPFASDQVYVGYKVATNTPTYVSYATGPFYHGKLGALTAVTTIPLQRSIRLRLETDENRYLTRSPGEGNGTQWLERATFDWQLSRDASFDVGVRKITGQNLPNAYQLPPFGNVNASNVTLAFHLLRSKSEFYVVYGDPNSLATTPALFLKYIMYIGAPKGT